VHRTRVPTPSVSPIGEDYCAQDQAFVTSGTFSGRDALIPAKGRSQGNCHSPNLNIVLVGVLVRRSYQTTPWVNLALLSIGPGGAFQYGECARSRLRPALASDYWPQRLPWHSF